MPENLNSIEGFDIFVHEKSKRIINLKIEDEIIDKLIFHLINLILPPLNTNLLLDLLLLKA